MSYPAEHKEFTYESLPVFTDDITRMDLLTPRSRDLTLQERQNLERVAATRSVTLSLVQYEEILSRIGFLEDHYQSEINRLDAAFVRVSSTIQTLEGHINLLRWLHTDRVLKDQRVKARCLEILKTLTTEFDLV